MTTKMNMTYNDVEDNWPTSKVCMQKINLTTQSNNIKLFAYIDICIDVYVFMI